MKTHGSCSSPLHFTLRGPSEFWGVGHRLVGFRHLARSRHSFGLRHFMLGDNLGVVLAGEKGRATSFKFLTAIRRDCAVKLAANITVRYRWLPSELNRSDT